ncbi:MAG: NADH-quinone oxidoreductase subunit M [Reichenbachiella sp.]
MLDHILSIMVFLPLIGALLIAAIPKEQSAYFRVVSLIVMSLELLFALILVFNFDSTIKGYGSSSLQFVEKLSWIDMDIGAMGSISIKYFLAVDGLNIILVLLSALVLLVGVISSWNITESAKGYFILYLVLSTSVIGCFVAIDMFLFFLFFEFMLLPMYFLIGIWGGKNRAYASLKFYIYTLFGSLLILMVMIGLSLSVVETPGGAVHTFDIMKMMNNSNFVPDSILSISSNEQFLGVNVRMLSFLLICLGFAIKLPAVPLHTWLPDAHVEAPTPISVVLAGVLLKVGGYGFFRLGYTIFPEMAQALTWWIALFGVIAIVYAALVAMAQSDLKRLIAYSSVSHMGFVMLGLASLTVTGNAGAIFQMFSHGIISALLFLLVGVIYDRTGNREIGSFSGLASKMPRYTVAILISFFAALGLPGLSGFIAEFLVLLGAFDAYASGSGIMLFMPILGLLGLVLGAAYFLWTLQRMFFGEYGVKNQSWELPDLTVRELIMVVPLLILTILFGVFPSLLLDLSNETIVGFIEYIQSQGNINSALIHGAH